MPSELIVVDASVLVAALVSVSPAANKARDALTDDKIVCMPHLADLEITNALRNMIRRKEISEDSAFRALTTIKKMEIVRYPHTDFLDRIWELRNSITPYDAAYIALTEALQTIFITADKRLSQAHGIKCKIELLA